MTDMDHRIEITWRRGAYYISVPNYQGGTVYTKEYVDGVLAELADARSQLVSAKEHLGWIKLYAEGTTIDNWRDMKLRIERQVESALPDD